MTESLESAPLAGVDLGVSLPPSMTGEIHFNSESEEALALRFSRRAKVREALTFEFTRDPALLLQYYDLYDRECRVVHDVQSFRDAEEEHNRKGHILVVRQGNQCIGGGRLSVRTPRQTKPLPVELGDFRLDKHFPELEQKQMRYGEFSRLVLLQDFRGGDITLEMWRHFYRKSVALNLDVVYAVAPLLNIRAYRKNSLAIGMKETKIHHDIDLPPYPGFEDVKDYLLSIVIDKSLIGNYPPLPETETAYEEAE